ncbi:unnamed protein product, partial [Polarella glacialis]
PHQGEAKAGGRGRCCLRNPVLDLCKATSPEAAEAPVRRLRAALLRAEATDAPVDSGLVGMAAAQSARLGLKDLLCALCSFSWPRLSAFGAREVAELAAAATKCGCEAPFFYCAVVAFCYGNPGAFTCLRDVALVATAIGRLHLQDGIDLALAFYGLSIAALPHLLQQCTQGCNTRDVVEFFHSLANALESAPLAGGQTLVSTAVAVQAVCASVAAITPGLPEASAQDVAKAAGATAVCWSLMPDLQATVLSALLIELIQAVHHRQSDLNLQDLSLLAVAFAKLGDDPSSSSAWEVLSVRCVAHVAEFSPKDLSLLLWAAVKCKQASCGHAISRQVAQRNLSTFSSQDLCMTAQGLAKLERRHVVTPLCLVAGEVFARQALGLSAADKALILWSLAKVGINHIALRRLLVRHLAMEKFDSMPRDVVGIALWALAVTWSSREIISQECWPRLLAAKLLSFQPWQEAPAHEVANAAWGCAQLPADIVVLDTWTALCQSASCLELSSLKAHELCNLLAGMAASWLQLVIFFILLLLFLQLFAVVLFILFYLEP